jgi:hypothetical protein
MAPAHSNSFLRAALDPNFGRKQFSLSLLVVVFCSNGGDYNIAAHAHRQLCNMESELKNQISKIETQRRSC